MSTVTISLVSHTNVGKTTLARTLLRSDIGEILDHAHVTDVSEAHVLIENSHDRALLWDTPGFGDTNRLMQRLRREKGPIGWFLHQVWDRVADRPLWCSQEAIRNVREDADVVFYLVNAAEDAEDAGYIRHELELLGWLRKPVFVLLNQTGSTGEPPQALEEKWRRFLGSWTHVRGVQSLDAFRRCWVQEGLLFEHTATMLEGEKRDAARRLARAWNARHLAVFHECVHLMASYLARAATEREELRGSLSPIADKKRAMQALGRRLEVASREFMDALLASQGLEGGAADEIRERVEHFIVRGIPSISVRKGALLGGILSGALGGLAADVMAGGLTFGGGLVAGAILGAIGGASLTQGVEFLRGSRTPSVAWSPRFLDSLLEQTLLRYLAVAHHGRGQGGFEGVEEPQVWAHSIADTRREWADSIEASWSLGRARGQKVRDAVEESLVRAVREILREVLVRAYPEATKTLDWDPQ